MKLKIGSLIAATALLFVPTLSLGVAAAEQESTATSSTDFETAAWNGLWYSHYVLDHLALFSGLGATFSPPESHLEALVGVADAPADTTLAPPEGAQYLQAVFAGADASAASITSEGGFDPATVDTRVTPAAQAMAIALQTEWAKLIRSGSDIDLPQSEAEARLRGHLYMMAAKAQADFALVNLRDESGDFLEADWSEETAVLAAGTPASFTDQLLMLRALSSLALTVSGTGSEPNVYEDERFRTWFEEGADEIFARLAAEPATTAHEASEAIQALAWYAATIEDPGARSRVIDSVAPHAEFLAQSEPESAMELARTVRGLSEYGFYTQDPAILAMTDRFADLLLTALYAGLGEEQSAVSVWEVGELVGSLNVYRRTSTDPGRQEAFGTALAELIDNLINTSGMLTGIPEPSPTETPGAASVQDPLLGHPDVPRSNAIPPVLLAEVTLDVDTAEWRATAARFDTGGALYAALELLRVGDFVPSFAPLTFEQTPNSASPDGAQTGDQAAESTAPSEPVVVEITSEEFSFSQFVEGIPASSEVVLRLTNNGVAPHNIDLPGLGVFVEANGGEYAEVTFTAPDEIGVFEFICNIPGHSDAGMTGTFKIVEPVPLTNEDAASAAAEPGPATPKGAVFLPPEEVDRAINFMTPALIFALGFALAVYVYINGMLRFARLVDDG